MLKLSKKQRHAAATSTPDYSLHDGPRAQDICKKIPPLLDRPDVLLPGNKTLRQPRLPPLLSCLCPVEPPSRSLHAEIPPASEGLTHDEFAADAAQEPDIVHMPHSPVGEKFRHQRKRATQWARWQTDILPTLVPHFARFLSQTKSLRDMDRLHVDAPRPCECSQVSLKVAIVRFHRIDDIRIHVCKCNPASVQLMRLGAFGSAPLMPSLAVDLRVLEFTRTLFLAISPNNTAISQALETFLSTMGYQLDNRNSLRRRFANALMWYTHLKNLLKSHYEAAIQTARETLLSDERGDSPQTPRGRRRERSAARSPSLSQTTVHRRRSSTSSASRSATPTPAPNRKLNVVEDPRGKRKASTDADPEKTAKRLRTDPVDGHQELPDSEKPGPVTCRFKWKTDGGERRESPHFYALGLVPTNHTTTADSYTYMLSMGHWKKLPPGFTVSLVDQQMVDNYYRYVEMYGLEDMPT
ncbi:hypothetical protein R3P38DRAFT_3198581 [Favolaschia claudopus]|uniref:CxC1-like cysteine cluster associated with KDZ transposases domain-containing protein n=1 Tax=Favolaschia claudopus TaxID=2862362 RepID=A0AAW0B4B0_9AGAR